MKTWLQRTTTEKHLSLSKVFRSSDFSSTHLRTEIILRYAYFVQQTAITSPVDVQNYEINNNQQSYRLKTQHDMLATHHNLFKFIY